VREDVSVMLHFILVIASLFMFPDDTQAKAVDAKAQTDQVLSVGIAVEPPFVIDNNGRFTGVSIELWEMVARGMGWKWKYETSSLSELLEKVKNGKVDVALGAITRTSAREKEMDFSASYLDTGVTMVTLKEPVRNVFDILSHLGDSAFLQLTGSLVVICILFGMLIWWAERRRNADHFGGHATHGFGSGIWWSMVTMSTVGYGDKAPRTAAGRVLGLIWIFLSIILLSAFTGTVASSMTMGRMGPRVSNIQNLRGLDVGSLDGSEATTWMNENNISTTLYTSLQDGMNAVLDGSIKVFVGDRSAISWLVSKYDSNAGLIIEGNFHPERLCYAFPSGSQRIEPFNIELLSILESRSWRYLLAQYGEQELLIEKQ